MERKLMLETKQEKQHCRSPERIIKHNQCTSWSPLLTANCVIRGRRFERHVEQRVYLLGLTAAPALDGILAMFQHCTRVAEHMTVIPNERRKATHEIEKNALYLKPILRRRSLAITRRAEFDASSG